jgi:predicted nucleotidyltransferase
MAGTNGGSVLVRRRTRTVRRSRRLVPRRLQAILDEVEGKLRDIYGDCFLGLVLFGSYARGDAVKGSDIDLILLLRDCAGVRERRHYAEAIAELSLRHDVVISLVPMGIEEYRRSKTPFLLNVRREGIRL